MASQPLFHVDHLSLDPDSARLLFDRAGKLLIRSQLPSPGQRDGGLGHLPPHSDVGIDFAEWAIGPDFLGLKFIPPGLHFFHHRFSKPNSAPHNQEHAFRNGFFFWVSESQAMVLEWNPLTEDLIPEPLLDPDHVSRLKHNMREFDRYLGTYPLESSACTRSWPRLTCYITPDLLDRILPTPLTGNSKIHPLTATMESTLSDPSLSTATQFNHASSSSSTSLALHTPSPPRIHFTAFDLKRSWDPAAHGASPAQVTKWSLDKSWLLLQTIQRAGGHDAFLGEFQLAFVCLLVGHNYEGFEQWKRLMHLVCQARQAVVDEPEMFVKALDVIHHQLAECPKDFFIDLLSSGNFVYRLLSQLLRTILNPDTDEPPRPSALIAAMKRVGELCLSRFGMELQAHEPGEWSGQVGDLGIEEDDDDDEDRPVVLNLSEEWVL